jgi:phosphohistidine phosphatase
MRLHLVQHGEAVSKDLDPERPLTARGCEHVSRLGRLLAHGGITVDRVLHSGKRRAEETATILARALSPPRGAAVHPGLAPKDPPEPLAKEVAGWSEDTLLVAHMPILGRLTSLLVCGKEGPIVRFVPGTLVTLERDQDGDWRVVAILPPGFLEPPSLHPVP